MRKEDFFHLFLRGCDSLEIASDLGVGEKLFTYFGELKKWSSKINLIGKAASDEEILELHFLDSLTLLKVMKNGGEHLLDIGSGAGFPGLVYAAANKGSRVSLVESRRKRCVFLNHIRRTLELEQVTVYPARIEDDVLDDDFRFDYVVSRAVSDIGALIRMVERFRCKSRTVMICMKGPHWKEELDVLKEKYGCSLAKYQVKEMIMPFSGSRRALVSFKMADVIEVD